MIALLLGHERPNTTHLYVEADRLTMKRRTLAVLAPPKRKRVSKTVDGALIRFLDSL